MKTEVLLRSIGKINDELIADAESEANTKRKPGWAKLGTMAACLALVLCTGIATHAIRNNATAGTFTMDVNPSVEYTIAKSGAVKSIRSLNSDAENALSDVALGKQSVETALTRTVAAYEACGYMENGEATVLISFDSRLDANAELKASLSAEIQQAQSAPTVVSDNSRLTFRIRNQSIIDFSDGAKKNFGFHSIIPSFSRNCLSSFLIRKSKDVTLLSLIPYASAISRIA